MMKTLETILNIISYGFLVTIGIVIIRIGMKVTGFKIFGKR